jgi:deoxyxylulose-5-phosphate synthase
VSLARNLAPVTSLDFGPGGIGGVGPGIHRWGILFQLILSLTTGEDGPSQMALEDLAMFRSVPMSTVFYPSDGVATEKAVELAANTKVGHIAVFSHTGNYLFPRETEEEASTEAQIWSLAAPEVFLIPCPWCLCSFKKLDQN